MDTPATVHGQRYIVPIDGLRAVAVLVVLLFHVDFWWAEGGFVGVDIFFVISGFLITRNIVHDIDGEGWSASSFYVTRVARLFPALFVTIAATLIAALWVLSPYDLERLGRAAAAAILSVGNILFWLESGYFDAAATSKPLLHTWSLAVEEQFYLVWPTLLLALSVFGKPARRVLIVLLIAISLGGALWYMQKDSAAVFFLAPFRVHQFGLGAFIAVTALLPRNTISSLLCGVGLISVGVITFFANGAEQTYWLNAVAPALAATAIIGSSRSAFAETVLGSAPFVWIGRRSYSIYLAHWPIIVLWKMKTDFEFSLPEQIAAIGISVVVGTILHAAVERPFRFRRTQSPAFRKGVLAGTAALAVVTLSSGVVYAATDILKPQRSFDPAAISNGLDDRWALREKLVKNGICSLAIHTVDVKDYNQEECSSPPKDGQSYLIVGDSFANDAYMVLTKAYPGTYFGQIAVPGCLLRLPKQFEPGELPECRKMYELAMEDLIRDPNYDGIVLTSNWLDRHYYRIADMINYLEPLGKEIIVIGQRPHFNYRIPEILMTGSDPKAAIQRAKSLERSEEREMNEIILERFSKSATILDFYKLQCPDECLITDRYGRIMYLDEVHLSVEGAEEMALRLRNTSGGIFSR